MWHMPIETAAQTCIWMAFPPSGGSMQESAQGLDNARRAWSEVAHAILDFEPVKMVVNPPDMPAARTYLSRSIELFDLPLDDAWMRDIGPSFVVSNDHQLGAVNWRFNGWGQQAWSRWHNDQHVARQIAAWVGAECIDSSIVNEGGAIQVDGCGSVLATTSVQLDKDRNPGKSHTDIEAEFARTLGAEHTIWLERGLYRDSQRYGTRGHVDMVAAIPAPGMLLVHDQQASPHPDHAICAQLQATLDAAHTAESKPWHIRKLPAPKTLRDKEGFVDYSYINHVAINDAVVACTFNDPMDDTARAILEESYPGRKIVGVDAREIFQRGGGIHCITQQQP